MNIVLKLGYNGNYYSGFQKQKNTENTIQNILELILSSVLKESISIVGASRTDSGVHALGQMVQFSTKKTIPYAQYIPILNNKLPDSIRIYRSYCVGDDFHVRYQAIKKKYLYMIDTNRVPSILTLPFTYHYSKYLDVEKMARALKTIEKKANFKAFCASGSSVKKYIRHIYEVELFVDEKNIINISITGNGFLYNMIRIIVGTLIDIGRGFLNENIFLESFDTLKRETLGRTAPNKGLILKEIVYEKGVLS